VAELNVAPALPDRARFVLEHCTGPMRFRGSLKDPAFDVVHVHARYQCDDCGALLELRLTESA
jgi:hypothetical protein